MTSALDLAKHSAQRQRSSRNFLMPDVLSEKSIVWLTGYTKKIMLGNTGLDVPSAGVFILVPELYRYSEK